MNIRSRTEKEIVRNLDVMSLSDIFLMSTGSKTETNLILVQILNQIHSLNTIRLVPNSTTIHQMPTAA